MTFRQQVNTFPSSYNSRAFKTVSSVDNRMASKNILNLNLVHWQHALLKCLQNYGSKWYAENTLSLIFILFEMLHHLGSMKSKTLVCILTKWYASLENYTLDLTERSLTSLALFDEYRMT